MEIMVLLFETGLKIEDLITTSNKRFEKFKDVKGLLQKFYISDRNSKKIGGIYVFDSKENLEAFRESELSKSTSEAYKFLYPEDVTFYDVSRTLREL
ncbi:MAG: YdhR family protein [Promethearchaeota archaeon]|jgi:hypothetical protein